MRNSKLLISLSLVVLIAAGVFYLASNRHRYTLAAEWGGFGYADEDGKFQLPYGSVIYKDENGEEFLLITDCHNHNVQKFDLDGNFISKFGSEGEAPGLLNTPADIAVDKDGNIWIVEEGNDRISKFDKDWNFLDQLQIDVEGMRDGRPVVFSVLSKPLGIAFDSSNTMYISNNGNNLVIKFNAKRGFNTLLNQNQSLKLADASDVFQFYVDASYEGTAEAEFNYPYYLAIDSKDNVYVVDRRNHRIQKFSPDGEFILKWGRNGGDGTPGNGEGEFDFPHEIEIDKNGNIYVADTNNHRIQLFDSNGKFLFKFGDESVFINPKVVTVDSKLNIYVGDIGHRAHEEEEIDEHLHHIDHSRNYDVRITKWKKTLF
ncbi:6-bladed beta-propeller [Patescibacteria group bacterium]|nr:6-bladed beta-propeller [Patescibacteria group bacterium]